MAAIPATGLFKQPERVAYLIASCATFRTIVSESTAAAALTHIAWPWTDDDDEDHQWPRAIVTELANWRTTQSGRKNWSVEASLYVSFQFEVPVSAGATTELAEHNWFMNQIGAIVSEMKTAEGSGTPYAGETQPAIAWIQIAEPPTKEEESESEISDPASAAMLPRWWIVLEIGLH